MLVLKFGGTSIGTVGRVRALPDIIDDGQEKVVVLSALSGATNTLEKFAALLYRSRKKEAEELILVFDRKNRAFAEALLQEPETRGQALNFLDECLKVLLAFIPHMIHERQEKVILSQGELISTHLVHFFFHEQGIQHKMIPALNFMRIDKDGEPDHFYIRENLEREINQFPEGGLFLTQGYICKNVYGETDNLKRGGSDYSASIIASALNANEVQIWTDISGVHNNDPRFVENTYPVPELSFEEAAELAYFGAKIIHPSSLLPARQKDIPVRLKNTFKPGDPGTLITSKQGERGFKSIAAKDGITVIKIRSARMLLAYGFLRKVFEVFEKYRTPVDVITTSEVAVSLTIDDETSIEKILEELKPYGHVEVESSKSIVSVVGNIPAKEAGYASAVFEALKDIAVRMISYGGSNYNITLVVDEQDKQPTLQLLNKHLEFSNDS